LLTWKKKRRNIPQITEVQESLTELHYRGNISYKAGNYAEAIKCYSNIVDQNGNPNPIVLGNRAASYCKLRQFRAALLDYEKAESIDPLNIKLLLGKAFVLEKLKDYDAVFQLLQNALAICISTNDSCKDYIIEGLLRIVKYTSSFSIPIVLTSTTTLTTTSVPESYKETKRIPQTDQLPTQHFLSHYFIFHP